MAVYLDWNATAPPHPEVVRVMSAAATEAWANPSSVHAFGRRARDRVEGVRERLAQVLGFDARDVLLTGGGTEANHLALQGATHLVTSRLEHPSVSLHSEHLAQRGTRVEYAQAASSGRLEADAVAAALNRVLDGRDSARPDERVVVAAMAVNHETGVVQPLDEIASVTRRVGAHLHVDAVQLLGRGPLDSLRWADSVAVASHKIRGGRGVGALTSVCGWSPRPLGRGGAQEKGLRPGTVDALAVIGFGAALERLDESVRNYLSLEPLRDHLEAELSRRSGGRVSFHGRDVARLAHVSNWALPGWRGDELVAALDLAGVAVSSGSACSAGTAEPSAVVSAMLGRDAAVGAVRVSLGEDTTPEDVDTLLAALDLIGAFRA